MLQQKTNKQNNIKNERAKNPQKPDEEPEKEQQLLCHQYFKNRYLTVFLFSQCLYTEYTHIVTADYFHILTT